MEQFRQRYVKRICDSLEGGDGRRMPTALDLAEVLCVHPRDPAGDCIECLVSRFPGLADRFAKPA